MKERFLKRSDFADQIKHEIKHLLDGTPDGRKIRQAEEKATAQMVSYLSSRYNTAEIFKPCEKGTPDNRNPFVIMILIDLILYHLWCAERAGNIPKTVNDRYQDALDWLNKVGTGELISDLPPKPADEVTGGAQIYSLHPPDNHRF